MSLYNYFIKNRNGNDNKNAIHFNNQNLNFREVHDLINFYIHFFKNEGISINTKVVIALDNIPEYIPILFALSYLGSTAIPVNKDSNSNSLNKLISNCKGEYLLSDKIFIESIKKFSHYGISNNKCLDVIFFDKYSIKKIHKHDDFPMTTFDNDIDFIFTATSGSTGDPKAIVLSQKNKINRIFEGCIDEYDLIKDDVVLCASPIYHSLGLRLCLIPFLLGCSLVLLKKFSPTKWIEAVHENEVTFSISVSAHLVQILPYLLNNRKKIKSLKNLVASSSILPNDIRTTYSKNFNMNFFECYGTSEVGIATSILIKDELPDKCVGTPLKHVEIIILDSEGNKLDNYKVGQIAIRSLTSFKSYFKIKKRQNNLNENSYFETGDYGYLDNDNMLYFQGRKQDLINVGGSNVFAVDIENIINSHDDVAECAVIGKLDKYFGEVPIVFIVPANDNFKINHIKKFCIDNMSDFQLPREFTVLEKLPKTPLGKLQKHKLINNEKQLQNDYNSFFKIHKK